MTWIVGGTRLEVNSRHHQVVHPERPGAGLRTVAVSADRVIEASEDCAGRFLLTVQWHPEDLLERREHLALFAAIVEEAARGRA
jgi:putative glutamine amidotransferase